MNVKDDLVRHLHWLRQYGLNDSHSGVASVRLKDGLWITPADACADTLSSADLVHVADLDGTPLSDGAAESSGIHVAIYQANPAASVILQSHGPYTVAMTLDSEEFRPSGNQGQFSFDRVPVLTIPFDCYDDVASTLVAETLVECPIAVVRGHGVFASAANLSLAYRWSCALELSAQTAFIAQQAGKL